MSLAVQRIRAWSAPVSTRHAYRTQGSFFFDRHLRTSIRVGLAPQEGRTAGSSEPNATELPATKPAGFLAKDALIQILKSGPVTARDVVGEDGLSKIRGALGDERAGTVVRIVDKLLANRRLATFIFAVVDVALIWGLIKVFQTVAAHN